MARRRAAPAPKKTQPARVPMVSVVYAGRARIVCEHDRNRWAWTGIKPACQIPVDAWEAIKVADRVIARLLKVGDLREL